MGGAGTGSQTASRGQCWMYTDSVFLPIAPVTQSPLSARERETLKILVSIMVL